jgi:iron complex transport system substrate-binding protein
MVARLVNIARTAPLLALTAAVAAAGLLAAAVTPAELLVTPERALAGHGSHAIRTGAHSFPREAIGADDAVARVTAPPRRIVSQSMSTDEFLYAIVPPDRVVGVSETAFHDSISNVSDVAKAHRPIVANDVERVLRSEPDLVFAPAEGRSEMPALLRAASVPVYRMPTMFETLASIEEHIRLVGYLSGEDARAEAEARRFRSVIERASARKPAGGRPPRVMGFGGLYSYGSQTLFSDILRVLGAENVAATNGFIGYDRVTDEHIVRWDPEWIIAGADRGLTEQVRQRLLAHPALGATTAARRGQIVVFEHHVFLPLSPLTARFVEALADALYGEPS